MTNANDNDKKDQPEQVEVDFHGAAIIDEEGHEIPITEEMVQHACEELDESCKKDKDA